MTPLPQNMRLMTLSQAAKLTPYSPTFLRNRAQQGLLAATKIGRDWLVTEEELQRFLQTQEDRHREALFELEKAKAQMSNLRAEHAGFISLSTIAAIAMVAVSVSGVIASHIKSVAQFRQNQKQTITTLPAHQRDSTGVLGSAKTAFHPRGDQIAVANNLGKFAPEVLGTSTTISATDNSQLVATIQSVVDQYISAGKLATPSAASGNVRGGSPAGTSEGENLLPSETGIVNNGSGWTTAVVGGVPIVSYQPQSAPSYSGGSFAGFTNLSGQNSVIGTETINNQLTVNGPTTITGTTNLTGSTTINSLVVTNLNPQFTAGSIVFEGSSGLTQDNSNFYWDSTNHRLGLGTTTPASKLSIVANPGENIADFASSTGASAFRISPRGAIGINTSTPAGDLSLKQINNGDVMISAQRNTDTAPTGDFIDYLTASGTTLFRVDNSGNLLAGGIINSGSQTITSTSTPQFRVQYDASDENTNSVSPIGVTTFAFNGASSSAVFIPQNNQTSAFQFQNAAGSPILSIDTINKRAGINTSTPQQTFTLVGSGSIDAFDVASSTGSSMFRVTAAGDVGIGMTNPGRKFAVNTGDISANADGIFLNGDGSSIKFTNASNTVQRLVIGYNSTDSTGFFGAVGSDYVYSGGTNLVLNTAGGSNNVLMQVDPNAGNVGINTTTPAVKLSVVGTSGNNDIFDVASSTGTSMFHVTAGGNVGVGTTAASNKLVVGSDILGALGTPNNSVAIGNASGPSALSVGQSATARVALKWNYNSTEALSYAELNTTSGLPLVLNDGGGNVGIGSTTPSARFVIQGSGTGSTNDFIFTDSNNNPHVVMEGNGHVGINTTNPQNLLQVSGGGSLGNFRSTDGGNNTNQWDFGRDNAVTGDFVFAFNGTSNVRFPQAGGAYFQNGNVGIGTTTSAVKLSVVGSGAADPFDIASSTGASLLHVAANGFVGIGTTAPGTALSVVGAVTITSLPPSTENIYDPVLIQRSDGTIIQDTSLVLNPGADELEVGGQASKPLRLSSGTIFAQGSDLKLGTSSFNPDITISNSTGNVGIGTTSPNQLFSVAGSGYFSGSVGIGTSNPTTPLDVFRNTTAVATFETNAADAEINLFAGGQGADNRRFGLYDTGTQFRIRALNDAYNTATDALTINRSGNSITSVSFPNGNVGIGTTTVPVKLTIDGSHPSIQLESSQTTSNYWSLQTGDVAEGDLSLRAGATGSGTTVLYANHAGNVGIGTTTPASKFVVTGGDSYFGSAAVPLKWGDANGNVLGQLNYGGSTTRVIATSGNSLGLSANGSLDQIFINTSGNVGIGTTTPLAPLDVSVNNVPIATFRIPAGSNNGAGIDLVASSSGGAGLRRTWRLKTDTTTAADFAIQVSTAEAGSTFNSIATFQNNGNVGIGTTSPQGNLDVQGSGQTNVFIGSPAANKAQLNWQSAGATKWTLFRPASSNDLQLDSSAVSNVMYFANSSGNVGIGTTTPAEKLDVNGNVVIEGGNALKYNDPTGVARRVGLWSPINNIYYGDVDNTGNNSLQLVAGGSGSISFNQNGSTKMILASSGKVGIGTTTPTSQLVITRSDGNGSQLQLSNTAAGGATYVIGTTDNTAGVASAGSLMFFDVVGNTTRMEINSSGNVGIGTTTPGDQLDIAGTAADEGITIENDGAGGRRYRMLSSNVGSTIGSGNFTIFDNNAATARLSINSSGNVGIGTTTPTLGPLVMASGAYVTSGGTWTNASDRNLKENFATLSPASILEKIDQLPITQWNYKREDPSITHIGPVAQDFYAAFHTGGSDTSISTIDPAGVALLGIQALDQKIAALQGELSGNAAAPAGGLSVYVPSNFSGDSVGEAEILPNATNVRVSFSQAYAYQPIVTFSPIGQAAGQAMGEGAYIDNVNSAGFTIEIPPATAESVTSGSVTSTSTSASESVTSTGPFTFAWHAFASPQEKLTVSDGTTQSVALFVAPTPSAPTISVSDPTSGSEPGASSGSSDTGGSDSATSASSTPDSTTSAGTSTPETTISASSTPDTTISASATSTPDTATTTPTTTASATSTPDNTSDAQSTSTVAVSP